MASISSKTDGPSIADPEAYDYHTLPDWDHDFIDEDDITAFTQALTSPENTSADASPARSPHSPVPHASALRKRSTFITALNDWRPVYQRVRRRKRAPPGPQGMRRGKDETREGFVYTLLKWPLLFWILVWMSWLWIAYLYTRFYIWSYEHWFTWRGKRQRLRKQLRNSKTYEEWVTAAKELDTYLGNDKWKTEDQYAYYNGDTIRKVRDQLRRLRQEAESEEKGGSQSQSGSTDSEDQTATERPVDELRGLMEACIKNNFCGFENPRLYSETYYGTKNIIQSFVDEVDASLSFLSSTKQLRSETKHMIFKYMQINFGRTALCLSGGATFAYYHFGVAKALLDADLLPQVITGTSGGALVAAMLATRTDAELKRLLVPALAYRITACHEGTWEWIRRWARSGARFDSVDWARRCQWFTYGSLTFREAYERTGRILNVSCVPSDPHSPTILANYITSPDCVIWSAVIASAAVPGILNPVVLMKKNAAGRLEPYSFGHKWKDGSLRTDIPLKALNLHFNVRFPIVSQVNPHVNLFFFSSRGSVGRPVTHRRGRGWRGGFLGSATEQFLKLDLQKWLKVLRHLELFPRWMGQDWSNLWLQRFEGVVTIHPRSNVMDFYYILSDPTMDRLTNMIHKGQLATFPKLLFLSNRAKIERQIEEGRRNLHIQDPNHDLSSDDEFTSTRRRSKIAEEFGIEPAEPHKSGPHPSPYGRFDELKPQAPTRRTAALRRAEDKRPVSMFELGLRPEPTSPAAPSPRPPKEPASGGGLSWLYGGGHQRQGSRRSFGSGHSRRSSIITEIHRQSRVFLDDDDDQVGRNEAEAEGVTSADDEVYETGEEGLTSSSVVSSFDGSFEGSDEEA
jgi:predicted acylesterase/phospholipase RssA